jgi:hypothetical protein
MIKNSINRFAVSVKAVEPITDSTKYIGRIFTRDGRAYHLIKGDKIVLVRRKKVMMPK